MPDEINANTMPAETDEKQGGSNLDANRMLKSDVEALTNKLESLAKKALDDLVKLNQGESCSAAESSILAFADELLFGTLYDFREQNKWLKGFSRDEADKFVNEEAGQTKSDAWAIWDAFYMTSGEAGNKLNDVYHYIQEAVSSGILRHAYRVIREDIVLRSEHYSDILQMINDACEEFYKVTDRYNHAAVYNEIPVKKENAYDVNLEMVKNHMLADFKKESSLGDIISTFDHPDNCWQNYFIVLDSDTKRMTRLPEISKFADENAKIGALETDLTAFFKPKGVFSNRLLEIVLGVIVPLRSTYQEARDIRNNYVYNTQEFPYSLMHYAPYVQKAAESCAMSLKDPVTNGTQYWDLSWAMLKRAEHIAGVVAKNAP
ncbi:MAG: hypothetical protein J5712_07915 [Lachnospiraceae bacterium]|nr:hypothetical protein [Lachnospiraceae bacterium]MBO4559989.1 hypothetical protein [Lachnospiraceae bacterium]MBR5732716.1 hypothetical protein [Lachnospiraceae bacterium]